MNKNTLYLIITIIAVIFVVMFFSSPPVQEQSENANPAASPANGLVESPAETAIPEQMGTESFAPTMPADGSAGMPVAPAEPTAPTPSPESSAPAPSDNTTDVDSVDGVPAGAEVGAPTPAAPSATTP